MIDVEGLKLLYLAPTWAGYLCDRKRERCQDSRDVSVWTNTLSQTDLSSVLSASLRYTRRCSMHDNDCIHDVCIMVPR